MSLLVDAAPIPRTTTRAYINSGRSYGSGAIPRGNHSPKVVEARDEVTRARSDHVTNSPGVGARSEDEAEIRAGETPADTERSKRGFVAHKRVHPRDFRM